MDSNASKGGPRDAHHPRPQKNNRLAHIFGSLRPLRNPGSAADSILSLGICLVIKLDSSAFIMLCLAIKGTHTYSYIFDKVTSDFYHNFVITGEQVYGLMWDGMSRRIAVLHEKSNRRKITMYGIDN